MVQQLDQKSRLARDVFIPSPLIDTKAVYVYHYDFEGDTLNILDFIRFSSTGKVINGTLTGSNIGNELLNYPDTTLVRGYYRFYGDTLKIEFWQNDYDRLISYQGKISKDSLVLESSRYSRGILKGSMKSKQDFIKQYYKLTIDDLPPFPDW